MVYIHESWFAPDKIKDHPRHKMCRYCGNGDPSTNVCGNCDIGFSTYIYLEDTETVNKTVIPESKQDLDGEEQ